MQNSEAASEKIIDDFQKMENQDLQVESEIVGAYQEKYGEMPHLMRPGYVPNELINRSIQGR